MDHLHSSTFNQSRFSLHSRTVFFTSSLVSPISRICQHNFISKYLRSSNRLKCFPIYFSLSMVRNSENYFQVKCMLVNSTAHHIFMHQQYQQEVVCASVYASSSRVINKSPTINQLAIGDESNHEHLINWNKPS